MLSEDQREAVLLKVYQGFKFDEMAEILEIPVSTVKSRLYTALDLLKAWGTGHPGGIGTIHAGSALGALRRLEQLIQEAVVTVPRALIAETVNVIAVLTGRGADRRLSEVANVAGLGTSGDYSLSALGDQ